MIQGNPLSPGAKMSTIDMISTTHDIKGDRMREINFSNACGVGFQDPMKLKISKLDLDKKESELLTGSRLPAQDVIVIIYPEQLREHCEFLQENGFRMGEEIDGKFIEKEFTPKEPVKLSPKEVRKIAKTILADLRKEAVYIGEDGDMCCVANNEKSALKKFLKLVKDEGMVDEDFEDLDILQISTGWLHLATEEQKRHMDDPEENDWVVSFKKESPYPVFVYRT